MKVATKKEDMELLFSSKKTADIIITAVLKKQVKFFCLGKNRILNRHGVILNDKKAEPGEIFPWDLKLSQAEKIRDSIASYLQASYIDQGFLKREYTYKY